MVSHFESTGHCIASGLGDLSFWCYRCESYLNHRTIPAVWDVYAHLHMRKFNEAPPAPPLPSARPIDLAGSSSLAAAASSSSSSSHVAPPSRSSSVASSPPSRSASDLGSTTSQCPIVGLSPLQMAHPLIQKITGIIYGNALGDAFGLSTEFLDAKQVRRMYGDTYDPVTGDGRIPFPDYRKTRHSARWDDGDWTDDTDQMILILETLLESYSGESRVNPDPSVLQPKLFARKLKTWARQGFPDLGDVAGMGLGALTYQVLSHANFLAEPHAAAKEVWTRGGCQAAANGGLMRTSIVGIFDYQCVESVIANTKNMCRVTHADPRCIASCVLATTIISAVLQGASVNTPEEVESLIAMCVARTTKEVDLGEHRDVFDAHVRMTRLEEMKLDEPAAIGYTFKCLASALFGLRSREPFIPTMTRLVREAGDADTNGAVCGAMLGAKVGYNGLPAEWLAAMPNKAWLDAKVVELIKLMMDRYQATTKTPMPTSHANETSART